jgi:hypothetical protein
LRGNFLAYSIYSGFMRGNYNMLCFAKPGRASMFYRKREHNKNNIRVLLFELPPPAAGIRSLRKRFR